MNLAKPAQERSLDQGDATRNAVFLISFKDRPHLEASIEKFSQVMNLDIYILDYGSENLLNLAELFSKKGVRLNIINVEEDSLIDQKNLACELARSNYDFAIISDDDIIFPDSDDIELLFERLKTAPEKVVMVSPRLVNPDGSFSVGGFLFQNATMGSFSEGEREFITSFVGGGPVYAIKSSYLKELYDHGLMPYEKIYHINNDDADFVMKVYLRGYKAACLTSSSALHMGVSSLSPNRAFHMYKNRVIFLLLNTSRLHVARFLPFRILQDCVSFSTRSITTRKSAYLSKAVLAYLYVLKNLRKIWVMRLIRQNQWRTIPHKQLQAEIFSKMPLPSPSQ